MRDNEIQQNIKTLTGNNRADLYVYNSVGSFGGNSPFPASDFGCCKTSVGGRLPCAGYRLSRLRPVDLVLRAPSASRFRLRVQIHAASVLTGTRHDNLDMSHATYRIINATNPRPAPRSQRYGTTRFIQQERIIKTIARSLSALNANSTIVAFATTCRALERPVLDILWESQDDWFQLLKCFPPDVWEERDNSFVSRNSARSLSIFTSLVNPILALPPQSIPSRVGSL